MLVIEIVTAVVCLCVPGLQGIGTGILIGALKGALTGGLIGGITSMLTGGSFLEGFAQGALDGAIMGGALGGVGGIAGKFITCGSKLGNAIQTTSKISGAISNSMDGFDMVSLGLGMIDPNNPITELNNKMHQSDVYNKFQMGVSLVSSFSGAASDNMSCFIAGTIVLTIEGVMAIELVKVGDYVISADEKSFEVSQKRVLETYIRKVDKLVHLIVGGEEIITTLDHPFFVQNRGFIQADQLLIGDILVSINGDDLYVENYYIELLCAPVDVYNFKVEDSHTYFVGTHKILVHNASDAYNKLRKVSPDAEARDFVNSGSGKKVDPVYGYEVDRFEADHIMSLKEITEQPGFDKSSFDDQKEIANLKENFMGLGKPSNASKGSKPISEWSGHSKLGAISKERQQMLNEKDKSARAAITKAISERLNKK